MSQHVLCVLLNILLIICFFIMSVIYFTYSCQRIKEVDERIDLANTTCNHIVYIGRRIFFHECSKDNKTVYDLRYFWKDTEHRWKANVIGVQMYSHEFDKMCKYCLEKHLKD